MGKKWQKSNHTFIQKHSEQIAAEFPDLHFLIRDRTVFLRGSFPLTYNGKEIDRYQIEIEIPHDYPKSLPIVKEISGRIPWSEDRHIERRKNGAACLFLPEERWEIFPEGSSFIDFLKGPVYNFFLGQSVFEQTGTWPFGERKHSVEGIFEYYAELIGTINRDTITRYIDILRKGELKGHFECPCGSGKKIRSCHFTELSELKKKIPYEIANASWEKIQEAKKR